MKMDEGIDTGGILSQVAVPIKPDDTAGSLSEKLAHAGAELLLQSLPRYLVGELQPTAQNEDSATHAPMLKKEQGILDWSTPAEELARRVQGLNPWPGAFLIWHAVSERSTTGRRLVYQGQPAIGTAQGVLVLDEVQPAGKNSMGGRAFLAGARGWES
jgi:methionyl-tRNA formyltransferase